MLPCVSPRLHGHQSRAWVHKKLVIIVGRSTAYICFGQFVSEEYKNGSSCFACIGMDLMVFTELSVVYMHYSIVSVVDQLSKSKKGLIQVFFVEGKF